MSPDMTSVMLVIFFLRSAARIEEIFGIKRLDLEPQFLLGSGQNIIQGGAPPVMFVGL